MEINYGQYINKQMPTNTNTKTTNSNNNVYNNINYKNNITIK